MPYGVRLVVAYDGTDFGGWQMQPNARTVQAELARAIERMTVHPVTVRGASRTDSGVHAEAQVAAFDSDKEISLDSWRKGLNKYLPMDIAVREVDEVAPGYDPRFDAVDKLYRYVVQVGLSRDPLMRRRAWHVHPGLLTAARRRSERAEDAFDLDVLQRVADVFVGTHDFRAFQAADDERTDTVRTLTEVTLIPSFISDPRLIAVEVRGTAFLKNMVRILVGTLVEVGRERMTVADVEKLLSKDAIRKDAGPTAPPEGLTLVEINLGRPPGASLRAQRCGAEPRK
jgi:tRNA pseudouridine38-40 synthase